MLGGIRPSGARRVVIAMNAWAAAWFGGRIRPAFTDDLGSVRRAAAGLRRLFPSLRDVRIEDAWGGPIDITPDHLPMFASVPNRPIHYAHGYSGNGVAPSLVGGRILAALAVERRDDPALALPVVGTLLRAFPPEPFRYVGARVVREAIVQAESAEERGGQPGLTPVARCRSRSPGAGWTPPGPDRDRGRPERGSAGWGRVEDPNRTPHPLVPPVQESP